VRAGDGSVCILAVGKMVTAAAEAALELEAEGIDVTVWDVRVVSDPDPAMVADAARHGVVVTIEDGVRQGGAGMFLAEAVRQSCPQGAAPPVISLGIPRAYIAQDKPDRILARLGLDGPGLARSVRTAVGGTVLGSAAPETAPRHTASREATSRQAGSREPAPAKAGRGKGGPGHTPDGPVDEAAPAFPAATPRGHPTRPATLTARDATD
jgi:hypothetical protein